MKDRERQREIASMGGRAAHRKGAAHQWTTEEAREAGRKGGKATRAARRMVQEGAIMHTPDRWRPGRPGTNSVVTDHCVDRAGGAVVETAREFYGGDPICTTVEACNVPLIVVAPEMYELLADIARGAYSAEGELVAAAERLVLRADGVSRG